MKSFSVALLHYRAPNAQKNNMISVSVFNTLSFVLNYLFYFFWEAFIVNVDFAMIWISVPIVHKDVPGHGLGQTQNTLTAEDATFNSFSHY